MILVTGSGGLIGRESVERFLTEGYDVVGIDNNMREHFFGKDGSVLKNISFLKDLPKYTHYDCDIRSYSSLELIFNTYSSNIDCIIHTAAQPSHDWAIKDPLMDYNINVTGTLNLLELTRKYCPKATFIYTSTNKVYGDKCNRALQFVELETRYDTTWKNWSIDESFSIDQSKHSLFGCSKLAADIYTQEYARYFNMNTVVFRGGCLTGSKHKGAELHGFLNYLVKCNLTDTTYNIYGFKGKQVRDNIHSSDLVSAFVEVYKHPIPNVYNIGGGLTSNCSILEAITIIESITGKKMKTNYVDQNRSGDHIWWISNISKFKSDYPEWKLKYNIEGIIKEIISNVEY